ncbi:hypothetical protein [Streptomyces sp. NPDC057253]|uniref:hypothetical protein n=1 Tax=Streptomyces sp. NPDC057253 TaxID=3346069 RepID=UPI00363A37B4
MNEFIVTAPEAGFSGESAGVVFKDGVGRVTDADKPGRAAIEYFRRRGYTLTVEGAEQETPDEQDGDEPFDPSKHNADEVIAYLDSLDRGTEKGNDEFVRVIVAELGGKARKTITDKEKEAAA